MATDAKYCYISTITSQSSDWYNYQNIPYRMPTTTPVVYPSIYYMPIAIWSTLPVFSNTVYYNDGTSGATYPTSGDRLLSMNQRTGPALFGNGAGSKDTSSGSIATPFFGRYQEWYGEIHDNWQVYTGNLSGEGNKRPYPPSAPLYVSADYTNNTYSGSISVNVYNYSDYKAKVYIELRAVTITKWTSSTIAIPAMAILTEGNTKSLSPGYTTFSYNFGNASAVRAIDSIRVYWYNESGNSAITYTYPVSFTISSGGGGGTIPAVCKICHSRQSQLQSCVGMDVA